MSNDDNYVADAPTEMGYMGKDASFSHEILVMRAYQKVQDALAQEMVNGYNSIEVDNNGREHIIYHKDNRHESMEAIKTLKNTMISDLVDTKYLDKINELSQELKNKYKEYVRLQNEYYKSLDYQQKQQFLAENKGFELSVNTNNLYPEFFYSDTFIGYAINVFREIFEQLELCLHEKKYFKKGKVFDINS